MLLALNLLALDTATEHCSVALMAAGDVRQRIAHAGPQHSTLLLPMVHALLAEAALGFTQLDGIAVSIGPGMFTGLRIGVSVAQGLAFGADLPVAAVGTLDAVAAACPEPHVVAALDARMDELYFAAFARDGGRMRALVDACLVPVAQPPALDAAIAWVGAGNGFDRFAALLPAALGPGLARVVPDVLPEARHVLAVACAREPDGFRAPPEALQPRYVRDRVAQTTVEREALRRARAGAAA
ncbi:MAG: tRNA (adenosine(37)-N6)-threonylcarbamoyltransferase complex dimerization subunit type 1 TsaB [Burkholderiales bacterium]|jgi:tRNA threonylcarbamoyladenosine biosynthesis protein TsaB|nr:tRNA (adenosine(37)-N6)-threonylcarbamoyltransferase complex dimerization subunit type 1 TsaB [Burkholderiales bacterium]